MKIAVQLYTVRKLMSDGNLDTTLKKIKDIGYDYVKDGGVRRA